MEEPEVDESHHPHHGHRQQQHRHGRQRSERTLPDMMASLSAIWESYAQLIRRKADRRSELKLQQRRFVLDKFLSHFVSASLANQGDICIGEMRNIGNELSQEFMRNLDVVTRGVSEEDATRSLEDYVLRGRGWRLLYTVDRVGLKGLVQRQDLCEVLLYLLPYCLYMKPSSPFTSGMKLQFSPPHGADVDSSLETQRLWQTLSDTYDTSVPLHSCFQLVSKSSRLKQLGCPSVQTRKLCKVTSTACQRDVVWRGMSRLKQETGSYRSPGKEGSKGAVLAGRVTKKRMTRSTPSKKVLKVNHSDTEEEDGQYNQQRMSEQQHLRQNQSDDRSRNRLPRFKRSIRIPHIWAPTAFNREEDSDTDDEYLGHMMNSGSSSDSATETLSSVTGFHVLRVLLRLLKSLGELDMEPHGYPRGRALSATILPHLLYLFSQFRQPGLKAAELNSLAKTELWVDSQYNQGSKQCSRTKAEEQQQNRAGSRQDEPMAKDSTLNRDNDKDCKDNEGARNIRDAPEGGATGPKSEDLDNCDVQPDEEMESVPWHGTCKMLVLRQLVRTILTLSGIVATQQNGVRILINLKVMDTLLDLDILDSLIPQYECDLPTTSTAPSSPGHSLPDPSTSLEATVAMEIVCGLLQLLQTVYTNLPFNPSCVSDANHLVSKLTKPEVSKRIKRLIKVAEVRTCLSDKLHSASASEHQEFDHFPSAEEVKSRYKEVQENSSHLIDKQSMSPSKGSDLKVEKDITEGEPQSGAAETGRNESGSFTDSNITSADREKEVQGSPNTNSIEILKDQSLDYDNRRNLEKNGKMQDLTRKTTFVSSYEYAPDGTCDPIRCIGTLITTLKGVKVNYIHSMKCLRQRHRNCEYGIYFDHHHDILGTPFYTSSAGKQEGETTYDEVDADYNQSFGKEGFKPYPQNGQFFRKGSLPSDNQCQPRCIVAELVSVLLESVSEVRQKSSEVHVISTLGSVGVCCCLQPERVVTPIVSQLAQFSPAVRSFALDTLTSILLDQFLGAREERQGSSRWKSHRTSLTRQTSKNSRNMAEARNPPGADGWAEHQHLGDGLHLGSLEDSSRCVHCYLEGSSPLLAGLPSTLDSGFASCQVEELRRQRMLDRWRCLRMMGRLVVGREQGLAVSCAKHLMTLAVRGNREIKEELFFGVYLHVLHMKVALPGRDNGIPAGAMDLMSSAGTSLEEPALVDNGFDGAKVEEKPKDRTEQCGMDACFSQANLQSSLDSLSNEPFTASDPATSGGDISTDEGYGEGYVSSHIMLLCVSALPYLLQVDKVMSIFLARRGLTKLTHLLEYRELRAPVMSVFEALVMIDERRLSDTQQQTSSPPVMSLSCEQSTYEGGGVIQTFIDTVTSRTCTVTATLQQISMQKEKAEAAAAAVIAAAARRSSRLKATEEEKSGQPLPSVPAENSEFLDMYKIHIKKFHDTVRVSDSESSNKDSKPHTPDESEVIIDTDTAFGDMAKTLPVLLDMWKTCAKLCMNSRMFRLFFRDSPSLYVVQETLVLALSLLGEMSGGKGDMSSYTSFPTSGLTTEPGSPNPMEGGGGGATRFWQGCSSGRSYPVSEASLEAGPAESKGEEEEEEAETSGLMSHQARLEFIEAVMMVCFSCRTISPSQKVNLQSSLCFPRVKGLEYSLQHRAAHLWNTPSNDSCPCFPAVFRLLVELLVACHRDAGRGVILHTVALRLLQTLRSSSRAVRAMSSEGLLGVLVEGFSEVLVAQPHDGQHTVFVVLSRLTSGLDEMTLLKAVNFEGLLTPDLWHMVSISYKDVLEGSTFVGKMTLTLDGWLRKEVILDHPASGRRPLRKFPFLCVGDARKAATKLYTGTWRMGTVRVFRDTVLSGDWWYHLYSLGPNHDGVGKFDGGEQPSCYTHSHAMLKQILHASHLSWDVLVGVTQLPDLDLARASQVLVYKISQPELFSTFVIPSPATSGTNLNSDLGLVPFSGSDLMTQKPQVWSTRLRGRIKVRDTHTLEKAAERIGGIETFLFLVAKVFEDSMKMVSEGGSLAEAEHLQSKATSILFTLVHRYPSLTQAFHDIRGYAMMAKVFTSSKSIVGYQLLKVLLDACTSDSLFKSVSGSPHPVLRTQSEVVIQDMNVLTELLLHWRIWLRATDDVRTMLVSALDALISRDNPHREFNLKQMQAGNVINKIFSIYLERIQDGQPSLSVNVSISAAKVVRSLLGSPPDLHLMMAVMDFLLLVHPAASGYISFNPEAFYSKLWWDGTGKSSASTLTQVAAKVYSRQLTTRSTEQRIRPQKTSDSVLTFSSSQNIESSLEERPKRSSFARPRQYPSSTSHTDEEVEGTNVAQAGDEVFKFPPLKPAQRVIEQSPDMDADHEEESDIGMVERSVPQSPSQNPTLTFTSSSVPSNNSYLQRSLESSSSSGEGSPKGDLVKVRGQDNTVRREAAQASSESLDETRETMKLERRKSPSYKRERQRKRSLRRQLFEEGKSAEAEAKEDSLDDTWEEYDESGGEEEEEEEEKPDELSVKSNGSKDDAFEAFEAGMSYDSAVNGAGSTTSHDEADEQGLMRLCVGLLEHLTEIVMEFPEPSLDNVFSKVVSPKSMLVLAKNPSADVRLAVIKLLGAYLYRAPSTLIDAFIKMDGFYLLANQLRSFPVHASHVEAAISIMIRQEFVFDDNFMIGDLGELTPVQQAAPILLLSFMDGTAEDPALCKQALSFLAQLLQCSQTMSTLLLDLGLAETMCNLATNIQRRNIVEPSPEEEQLTLALLIDLQHVLCLTAVNEFSWAGPSHASSCDEMFTLLKALEDHEFSEDIEGSKKRADNARALQISLVVKIFAFVEKRSEDAAQQGWITSSTTTGAGSTEQFSRPSLYRSSISMTPVYSSPKYPKPTRNRIHSFAGSALPVPYSASNTSAANFLSSASCNQLASRQQQTYTNSDMIGFLADLAPDSSLDMLGGQAGAHAADSGLGSSTSPHMTRRGDSKMSGSISSGGLSRSASLLGSLFNRKRRASYAPVSQSELLDRFRKILVTATDLAVMFPREERKPPVKQRTLNYFSEPQTPSLEDRYLKHLFEMVYRFYQHILNKDTISRKNRNPIMHGARDILKSQFTRLLLCMMSPKMDFDFRTATVEFLMADPRGPDAIKSIITDKQVGMEMSFYLYNLLSSWRDWLNSAQRESGFSLVQILRFAGFTINSPDNQLTQSQVNVLIEDKKNIDARYRKDLVAWLHKREAGTSRITQKLEPVRRRVTEQAMAVTQDVTRLQIEERKKLVDHIKRAMTEEIQLKKQWQELVTSLTHERGVWYHKSSYPQSWLLDPSEGPGRVRRKLQRGHMGIEAKFMMPTQQHKIEAESVDPPLVFLFEDDHQMSDSAALIYRLYTNEKIQHTCRCTAVSPANESKGELLVGEVSIFFVADGAITGGNCTQLLLGNLDQLSITWPHTDIRELHKRWYQLQDLGLEIFLISGRTCLLAFESTQDRDELHNILRSQLELPNVITVESLQTVQQAWLEGDITNYDYLIHLNKLAGRSYADLMQYPVFPFILRDYHSPTLNLTDPRIYRNLKKPIAVQDKTREQRYKDNYEFLCQEAVRPNNEDEMMMQVPPFHYGSHYSNSGTVLHYLVRLPPFTNMFLNFQDQSFDIPDRTFHSLGTSWRLSSFESSTDVKELIPEFFFLPEMFVNSEGFDFGLRQNGERVNDVCLPAWCEGDARLFVLIHRQALESAYVTAHLNHWLDLVFGYKQQGEEAIRAINVFHPSTYFGVDASQIKDPVKRHALLTMIKTYGQTPKQLFRTPHPYGNHNQAQYSPQREERLIKSTAHVRRPWPHVFGLQWGVYVGSPDLGPPVWMDLMQNSDLAKMTASSSASSSSSTSLSRSPAVITRLVPLPTGQVFGVESNANMLLLHGKQRDMTVKSTDVMWAGVVTWGYHDNLIRIRSYHDKPLINFLPQPFFGTVTCIESVPDCRLLFTAGSAGVIVVHTMTHNSSKPSCLQVRGVKKVLSAHNGGITCLAVCPAFSVLVSGSEDGTFVVWDLNYLTYTRSVFPGGGDRSVGRREVKTGQEITNPVTTVAISETLGDVASVVKTGYKSCQLHLHTINGQPVALQELTSDLIHCLAFSAAPEGRSVNVVATGLQSGAIRLWSTWDLTPLRDLARDVPIPSPVISVTFSADSQYLVASGADGSITLWDKDKRGLRAHADRFIPVISRHVDK
ncbi:lysosomal-trafficking regulator [Plakobranchus ocellatus]|uniref:Lysosomal-trafficking regulator n=1 Tax=Plakobranchus ocellatus TaxID=259542 RepID=A0AAV3XUQ9_9GAST|nr:lysosomal-trafficking regulator [Plakobranchus ocellatus]